MLRSASIHSSSNLYSEDRQSNLGFFFFFLKKLVLHISNGTGIWRLLLSIQSYSVRVLALESPITIILPNLLYLVSLSRRCNISKLFPHEETLGPFSAQRRLIKLGGCPGWSESLLGAQVILWVLSYCGLYHFWRGALNVISQPTIRWYNIPLFLPDVPRHAEPQP